MKYSVLLLILIAAIVLTNTVVHAADKRIITYKLQPKKIPGLNNGKVVTIKSFTGKKGTRLALHNLFIQVPVAVMLVAKSRNDDLRLRLYKYDWKNIIRSGSTKRKGRHIFKIRTQGDLLIHVSSPAGRKPYRLYVWVGNEIIPKLYKTVNVPKSK